MNSEQLQLVSPEYKEAADNMFIVAEKLASWFSDDIEHFRNGFNLMLKTAEMPDNECYEITKSIHFPHPTGPDWPKIPFRIKKIEKHDGGSSGYVTNYAVREGVVVSDVSYYTNREYTDEEYPSKTLSLDELRDLNLNLQKSTPIRSSELHKAAQRKGRVGQFVKQIISSVRNK